MRSASHHMLQSKFCVVWAMQVDMTNLNRYSATSDAIQLRPFEVLVQEWAALRSQVCMPATIIRYQCKRCKSGVRPAETFPHAKLERHKRHSPPLLC